MVGKFTVKPHLDNKKILDLPIEFKIFSSLKLVRNSKRLFTDVTFYQILLVLTVKTLKIPFRSILPLTCTIL